jgi:hypothetical protein
MKSVFVSQDLVVGIIDIVLLARIANIVFLVRIGVARRRAANSERSRGIRDSRCLDAGIEGDCD